MLALRSTSKTVSIFVQAPLAGILLLGATCGQGLAQSSASASPIIIGVPHTMSGPFSNFGKDDQIAFKMALDDINKAGGIHGRPLQFDFVDDQAKTDLTRSIVQKMIDVDKDIMILGGDTSATCTVIAQQVQQSKVPYLMHVCLADSLTQQGWNYVFRIPPPISQGVGGLTDFLAKVVQPKSIYLVYENSVYGTGIERVLKGWADSDHVTYTSSSFEPGGLDFRPVLTKVKLANPDVIMFGCYLADAITLTKQSAELGLKPKVFVGAAGSLYPEWASAVGNLAEYYLVPTQGYMDVKYPGATEFWSRYQQIAGKTATFSQASAYASVQVLKDVLTRVNLTGDVAKDRNAIRDALASTDVNTVFGPVKFEDFNGYTNQTKLPALLLQVQAGTDGKLTWHTVWPASVASQKYVYPVPGLQQ
jgi:branched-chain amino acid transport system substrate-binding protein